MCDNEAELKNAGAIELGVEIIEGLYEIIEMTESYEKRTLERVVTMIEALLEKDYNCIVEKEDKFDIRRFDS